MRQIFPACLRLSVLSEFLVALSLGGEEDALQTREEERNAGLGKVLRGKKEEER